MAELASRLRCKTQSEMLAQLNVPEGTDEQYKDVFDAYPEMAENPIVDHVEAARRYNRRREELEEQRRREELEEQRLASQNASVEPCNKRAHMST